MDEQNRQEQMSACRIYLISALLLFSKDFFVGVIYDEFINNRTGSDSNYIVMHLSVEFLAIYE